MAEIKPDILSALSQNGSGLQLQSLASSLVEAETSGERVLTERRVEDANTSISAMGQLSSQIGLFKAGMTRAEDRFALGLFDHQCCVYRSHPRGDCGRCVRCG